MREIKFRGFTKDRENRRWVYGSFHSIYNEKHSFTRRSYTGEKYEEVLPQPLDCAWILEPNLPSEYGWGMSDSFRDHKVHPQSVGQFTGLKDINGKEIYEGDVVRAEKLLFVGYNPDGSDSYADITQPVTFFEGIFWLGSEDFEHSQPLHYAIKLDETEIGVEIIGNIYENPELLNQ